MASSASLDELQRKFDEYPRRYLAPLANEYRKAGALDSAIELCRTHLPDYPEHLSGYVVFGQALYEAGELGEATAVFDTALSLDPENLIALRHMGDIARDRGDRVGARDWYERVLEADPRNEEIAGALQQLDVAPPAPAARIADAPRETPRVVAAQEHVHGDAVAEHARAGLAEPAITPDDDAAVGAAFEEVTFDEEAFAPGFFATTPDAATDHDVSTAASEPHEVDPSELALAAALDTQLVPEVEPPAVDTSSALDVDPAFDFQATSPDDERADDARGHADATQPAFVGDFETIDDGPFSRSDEFDASDRSAGDRDDTPLAAVGSSELLDEQPGAGLDSAPAYGHGFDVDALFDDGDADRSTPAMTSATDIGYESMEFVPPARDEDDAPDGAPIAGSPFVTETMAELYLQQGFRDEALDVYEQLLAASPRDQNLRSRVEQLRAGAASTLGSISGTGEMQAVADEHPMDAEELAAVSAADARTADDGAIGVMDSTSERVTARTFFLRLARMHGTDVSASSPADDVDFDGEAAFLSDEPSPAASEFDFVEPEVAAQHAAPTPDSGSHAAVASDASPSAANGSDALASSSDSLSSLFGAQPGSREDEDAASTLATLFGGGTLHHASGTDVAEPQMARAATPAFEQPTVRSATPAAAPVTAPAAPPRATPGTSFSFDQFFSDSTPVPVSVPTPPRGAVAQESGRPAPVVSTPAAPAPAAPTPAAPADDAGDLAQFNAWLEGLKKR